MCWWNNTEGMCTSARGRLEIVTCVPYTVTEFLCQLASSSFLRFAGPVVYPPQIPPLKQGLIVSGVTAGSSGTSYLPHSSRQDSRIVTGRNTPWFDAEYATCAPYGPRMDPTWKQRYTCLRSLKIPRLWRGETYNIQDLRLNNPAETSWEPS